MKSIIQKGVLVVATLGAPLMALAEDTDVDTAVATVQSGITTATTIGLMVMTTVITFAVVGMIFRIVRKGARSA